MGRMAEDSVARSGWVFVLYGVIALAFGVAMLSWPQRTVQVKAFSPLYFELLNQLPGLKEALALGDEVLVSGKDVAIQVGASGVERMTPAQLSVLVRAWQ